ncbi:SapC family protein [Massilia endophytica]|uniref:SapC family protein n=1 Tax=Massilia endophytica TaxID=2899220 RepID=UPI001E3338F6|nr:SapC family protein [Massilia endophytica]UGQ46937.1 SapC family protein [Massilia endophytica]
MSNPVLLNNVQHKNLRIITKRGAEYGDNVMFALTFPSEFRTLQAHYPIVFRKSDDGTSFEPVALFGLQEGENLFLTGDGWDATDLPLLIERQPFLIGRNGEELMMHVDMDSPRVSGSEGEAVFLPHGGSSGYLERMNSVLLAIHQGIQGTAGFVDALKEHNLLESFVVDIELDSGAQGRLSGFYTIHEERLAALDGAALERLHKTGYLQAIYMVVASMSNFRVLIDRKNRADAASR